jgi:hypothetical protein
MRPTRHHAWWRCAGLAILVAGCSGDGLVTCTGSVSYDATPVAGGVISFHPVDRRMAPQGGQIIAGRFRVRTAPGRHRVEVRASRSKADAVELTPGMRPLEQFIPARYNDASVLEAEVAPGQENVFTFELHSTRD